MKLKFEAFERHGSCIIKLIYNAVCWSETAIKSWHTTKGEKHRYKNNSEFTIILSSSSACIFSFSKRRYSNSASVILDCRLRTCNREVSTAVCKQNLFQVQRAGGLCVYVSLVAVCTFFLCSQCGTNILFPTLLCLLKKCFLFFFIGGPVIVCCTLDFICELRKALVFEILFAFFDNLLSDKSWEQLFLFKISCGIKQYLKN